MLSRISDEFTDLTVHDDLTAIFYVDYVDIYQKNI